MTPRSLLDSIQSPADLKKIPLEALPDLAEEVRQELLEVISNTGGHLASNLGIVELTIALLRVFDPPTDTIVWDTGHQGYVYKLLTGRRRLFRQLRQDDGCCGFLHRDESPCDAFGAGHAGTAISAAMGFAVARDQAGGHEKVVAVVGDGAMGCGTSLEGLNYIVDATDDLVLIINDNMMSIAPNVGAISRCLNRVISGASYNRFKDFVARMVAAIPVVGRGLKRGVRRMEEAAKGMLLPGLLFEELGLRYIGPLDGHDIPSLVQTFTNIRRLRQPIVIHVLTEKGHGYHHAEQAPEKFHGLPSFDVASGERLGTPERATDPPSFSAAMGHQLCDVLARDERAIAISAGMCEGTGLGPIRETYPKRFFDVGIAEEHAVVFAAGMAAAGYHPIVAIYATFMQRAMDYVFHDVCLQNLPVLFCLDRSGIVDDGPTHHGISDLAFWRALPNLTLAQPADQWELEQMMSLLLEGGGPAMIRYPKGSAAALPVAERAPLAPGRAEGLRTGADVAIWCLGREAQTGLEVADLLAETGIEATVVNARFLMPFDTDLLTDQASRMPIVTLEDHCINGGLGSAAAECLVGRDGVRLLRCGWPRTIVPWGTTAGIRAKYHMQPHQLATRIAAFLSPRAPDS